MSTHGHARGCGIAHSKVCRKRIKRALGETAEGRERLDRLEERRRNRQIKLENKEEVPAHLRDSNPCLRAGQTPSTPVAGGDGPRASPRSPPNQVELLPEESGEEEGEEEEATSMGEQASMEEDSIYAPSSPAGDDDQDMGLLSVMEVCPVLNHSVCEEEREELEDAIEETCILSAMLGDTRKGFRARAKTHTNTTVAEVYGPPRVTKAATLLPSLGIEPGAALDITTCDECGKP